jgi:hypothetical protein
MLSGEATNTNVIVFGLTRLGIEPKIYHTGGKHANHYSTNVAVRDSNLARHLNLGTFYTLKHASM